MAEGLARLPRPATERGRDAAGAVALAVALGVLQVVDDGPAGLFGWEYAGVLLACAALVWRRAAPVITLVVAFVACVASAILTGGIPGAFVPLAVAVYTAVSRTSPLPKALAIGALALVGVGVSLVVGTGRSASDPEVTSAEVWIGLIIAVGAAISLYRRSLAQERERALAAEATKDALASRKVAEERLRIARELHDAVGHHIAVMNVQAGVAEALLQSSPDAAAAALERVQEAGARVLEELPVMLRVLRTDGEAETRPSAGLADLPELIEHATASGLHVDLRESGSHPELPAATYLSAYRIVQEALTNAARHGDGAASVRVDYRGPSLILEVRNAVGGGTSSGSGFGLVGMRERALAAGGDVTVARDGDTFVVRAELPTRGASNRQGEGQP
ncbi:sensor histidine kinase [Tessaracoccus palaemonis]|uniref:histidine kinase n=1 Tax=Tessaracoccus palaemonis TaxID=2829499 RepID=A0ABX8SKK3_9ACTN|nr:histidine kinase [Tessaracoccus palaemonis]QXT63175.1 hypothetical protein KDB89_01430 [Tessaracoccus palaemonis]